MTALKTLFKTTQPAIERAVQAVDRQLSAFIQPRRAKGHLLIQPYIGWGNPTHAELTGRVLLPRGNSAAHKNDTKARNFSNILRRLFSREVGGIKITGQLGNQTTTATSDNDGYFTLHFTPQNPLTPGWHEATLHFTDRPDEPPTTAHLQITGQPTYGIISDLDDTVIQSDVTSLPRMLVTVLTKNARTRLPFPGVGALYRALTREHSDPNPIFYVSSSPWNFYDLLENFLHYRRIPLGPLFLRNWGMNLLSGHGQYKHSVIERILTRFPNLNFILIGDSGEKDPEIYAETVRRHPGRILAVYIRDVSAADRDQGILKLRDEIRHSGADLILAADSLSAASHAMSAGFITPDEYRNVLQSVARTYNS